MTLVGTKNSVEEGRHYPCPHGTYRLLEKTLQKFTKITVQM